MFIFIVNSHNLEVGILETSKTHNSFEFHPDLQKPQDEEEKQNGQNALKFEQSSGEALGLVFEFFMVNDVKGINYHQQNIHDKINQGQNFNFLAHICVEFAKSFLSGVILKNDG